MKSNTGHRYRVRFAILCWVLLIWLCIAAPSSTAMVKNPNTPRIIAAAMLLTVGFTILTFVLWLIERRKSRIAAKASAQQ